LLLTSENQLKALPGFTPSFLKMMAAGQKPVKADWIRLRPTKYGQEDASRAIRTHPEPPTSSTIKPAKERITRSSAISNSFVVL
jgi:hypothetical protein